MMSQQYAHTNTHTQAHAWNEIVLLCEEKGRECALTHYRKTHNKCFVYHTIQAQRIRFHFTNRVRVCICLLQTDSRAITSIKKRNQLMNFKAAEERKKKKEKQ